MKIPRAGTCSSSSHDRAPSTRMANAGELRAALVRAQNYMQKWAQYETDLLAYEQKLAAGEADIKPPVPPERDLKMEALGKALRREMRVHIHAHRADDILTAVRIAEEFNLDVNIEHATEGYKIASILAEKKIGCTVGPILFSRSKYELRNMTPANPGILARAGVKVAIQTDEMSAVRYLAINAALAVREGMPEEEAVKAVTINAAEIIGVQDRGSLNPADADVVIFSATPLITVPSPRRSLLKANWFTNASKQIFLPNQGRRQLRLFIIPVPENFSDMHPPRQDVSECSAPSNFNVRQSTLWVYPTAAISASHRV